MSFRLLLTAALLAALASCATNPAALTREFLDTGTGVTVTASRVPLVLYRDNPAAAAYARNVVHLGPIEINRSGEYRYYLWVGIWPGPYLGVVYLLSGLVALFWISLALVLGLRARHYFAAVVACILSGIIAFFLAGGLSPVRYYPRGVQWIARLFPNSYAIDPLRDLMLFHRWPDDWTSTLLIVAIFALVALATSFAFTNRQLRRLG